MKSKEHLVILTGHSSGLGLSLLPLCLQDNSHVLGIARRRLELQHPHLKQLQIDLSAPNLNVNQWLQPLHAFLDAAAWKHVTLVNNAGTAAPFGFLGQVDDAMIASSLHINLTVPLLLTNWLLKRFHKTSLRVVMISSGASHKTYPGWSIYCSSKAGLRMSAQVLAQEAEIQGRDLRVLLYEPGVLDTPMQEQIRATQMDSFPQGDRFRQLKSSGLLVSPDASARELWELICSPDLPKLHETRYGSHR